MGFFFEFFLKIVINWYSFSRLCDRRSFYDHSQNMWSTITHDHDRWNWVKKYLRSLMIVIWSEMIGDHDPISPTLPKYLSYSIPIAFIFYKTCFYVCQLLITMFLLVDGWIFFLITFAFLGCWKKSWKKRWKKIKHLVLLACL